MKPSCVVSAFCEPVHFWSKHGPGYLYSNQIFFINFQSK
ncbi:unnamed protein product [Acanthoscelides obtectus]|uniref:Uncharacterized protein n=1 Tax=Acanthoscelides obtectus TaxID=200917 RepID=A0A9P0M0C4_ACAOB|nr:unnamed protein product [Acanthoscelides obtectus]CAK1656963.1 hypothetical protein AOBTE_LOCUS20048 [Acanthoscelides obtectus]